MSPKTTPMQVSAAGAQARAWPVGSRVPFCVTARMKAVPQQDSLCYRLRLTYRKGRPKIGQGWSCMAEVRVRGVRINYETIGSSGPWIAFTPGSRRPYKELVGLSKAIARSGYRVLLHDRRNCGASEVAFDGSASENEIWADDLYELGRQLDALPLYVGGSSSGARLAILYALRHPAALRGLLLWRVTGGKEAVDKLAESYYGQFAKIARAGGMQAVCESEHFAACIKARPANRDKLMATNVDQFISVMTTWREMFLK